MFALNIGTTDAPELNLEGVVAGAPPSQFNLIYDFLLTSPYRYYLFMAAGGFNTAYGDTAAPLSEVLTAKGEALLPILRRGCSDYVGAKVDKFPLDKIVKTNPFDVPAWKTLLNENDPEQFTSASPVPSSSSRAAPTNRSPSSPPRSARPN